MPAFTRSGAVDALDATDPLLELLQRYIAELKVFNEAIASDECDWNKIALDTWACLRGEIIASEPRASTATGALLALDHVLQSSELFENKSVSAEEMQMLWHLIRAARDYIASSASIPTRNLTFPCRASR